MPTNFYTGGSAATTSSTQVIWSNWVTSASTSTASTDSIWQIWASGAGNSATISTTSATTNTIWQSWVSQTANQTIQSVRPYGAPISPQVTAEAAAARARQDEVWRAQREEEDRKRALADERALQLLVSVLSEQQKKDLSANGSFFVDAPASGRRYRINKGRTGNVKVVDKVTGVWTESLCIHQRDNVPVYDTMLMQKLLIETAEDEFRKVANITRKDGGSSYGQGLLDGERLARVLPFRSREERAAA